MEKVVVTGGAGFIGSHLTELLVGRGYRVAVLDDLSSGKLENIRHLLDKGQVEFVRGSITDPSLLKDTFKGARYVFHLAAIPGVPKSIQEPALSHEVNVTGTFHVLLAARDSGCRKVVFASSAAVYGDSPVLPKKEDMVPQPLSPYAVTKLSGEYYCRVFQEVYGLQTVCLRYFNVYGPRQDPDSPYAAVVPSFISTLKSGKPPVIFGDGEQVRDFIYVKDVAEANVLVAESESSGVFNVSHGEGTTVNQLAKLVMEIAEKRFSPVHKDARPGDIRNSLADVSKLKSLGYRPRYNLREGLAETVRWFDGQKGF